MREINNIGNPLPPGATVQFKLVDGSGHNPDVRDRVSGQIISNFVSEAVAGADGLFSISVWPNSLGTVETFYRVRVMDRRNVLANFSAFVADGEGALTMGELAPDGSGWIPPSGAGDPVFHDAQGRSFAISVESQGVIEGTEEEIFFPRITLLN